MDNPTLSFFLEQLNSKGWLGISNLYFDNAYMINVYLTNGYVAYSPGKEIFFAISTLDSTDTSIIEKRYVIMDRRTIGMQQNLTAVGADMLQHIDVALYSHYGFYKDSGTKAPYPTIPKKDAVMALTKDPKTGLYSGTDTAEMINNEQLSVLNLYPDRDDVVSCANVETWQTFYTNQAKFVKMLQDGFGVADAI